MKKRILITLDTEIHRQARVIAAQLGISVSKYYEEGARLRAARHSLESTAEGKAVPQ